MTQPHPKLVIIEGHDKGRVIQLKDGTMTIGRTKASEVIVQDPRVSRIHISIHYDSRSGVLSFTDLKSLNGTLLNGQRTDSGVLHDGDKLILGSTTIDCQIMVAPEQNSVPSFTPPKSPTTKQAAQQQASPTATDGKQPALDGLSPSQLRLDRLALTGEFSDEEFATREAPRPSEQELGSHSSGRRSTLRRALRSLSPLSIGYRKLPRLVRISALAVVAILGLIVLIPSHDPQTDAKIAAALNSARELADHGDLSAAITEADKARAEFPKRSEPYALLGQLYTKNGNLDLAVDAYERARDLEPEQPLLEVRLVPLYLRIGAKDKVETTLEKLDERLRGEPKNRQLFIEAAQMFLNAPELEYAPQKALILAKALQKELAPESAIGYKLEALLSLRQSRNKDAQQALEAGLKKSPSDEWLLDKLAFAKLDNRDPAGARDAVQTWLTINPTNTKALLVMAYFKYTDKDLDGALSYANEVVKLKSPTSNDPHDPQLRESYNLVGLILWQQGKKDVAKAWIERSCQMGFDSACRHESLDTSSPPPQGAQQGE